MNGEASGKLIRGLENVALVTDDRPHAEVLLERLGFHLSPIGHYSLKLGGRNVPVGLANRHVLLADGGYPEIVAPNDDDAAKLGYDTLLEAAGPRWVKISLALEDVSSERERLAALGVAAHGPIEITRRFTMDCSGERVVDMELLSYPPEWNRGVLHSALRHLDRSQNYPRELLHHPNGARRLRSVTLGVGDDAETLQRYCQFTGRTPRIEGALDCFEFGDGTRLLLDTRTRGGERVLEVGIDVADLTACRRWLEDHGVDFCADDRGIVVDPAESLGTGMRFSAG